MIGRLSSGYLVLCHRGIEDAILDRQGKRAFQATEQLLASSKNVQMAAASRTGAR